MKSMSEIHQRAIIRARAVQAKIDYLRAMLDTSAPRPFRDTSDTCEDIPNAAVLASYDRELDRLCAVDGVMIALLEDLPTPESA